MLNQLNMKYLSGCYQHGDKKDQGMCAIQAFALAWELNLEVPDWAMKEIGRRFSDYWRENTAEGLKGQSSLDTVFKTNRAFQRINTATREVELVRLTFHFQENFGLNRAQAIAVIEESGLNSIQTKEGKGLGKTKERIGKVHVINRSKLANKHYSYKKLFKHRVDSGVINLEETRQQIYESLSLAAQTLIRKFQNIK